MLVDSSAPALSSDRSVLDIETHGMKHDGPPTEPSSTFEIEEDFDPALLGVILPPSPPSGDYDDNTKGSSGGVTKGVRPIDGKAVDQYQSSALSVTPTPSPRPLTALDLLRAITSSSPLVNPGAMTPHPPGTPFHNLNSSQSPAHTSPVAIARDFAEQDGEKAIVSTDQPNNHLEPLDMSKAPSVLSTAESTVDTISVETDIRPRPLVKLVRTRIPGSKRYRTAIRVLRSSTPLTTDHEDTDEDPLDTRSQISAPVRPEPPTQFQRDISEIYGREILDKIEHQSKLDSTIGSTFPPMLRDLFPALSDLNMTVKIVNVFRRQLDLPLLDARRTDKIAMRRSIAKMREGLYIELMAALSLPLAPPPKAVETDGENTNTEGETEGELDKVTLTPTNLQILEKKLPKIFSAEKGLIKSFLAEEYKYACGEKLGHVVWQGGIGRMRGKGVDGFRGQHDIDGQTHVFVDHSNILHGLIQHLYVNPSDALPPRHLRTLSLPALSLLLRRGRFTPPGSLHLVASSPLQQNLDPLVRLGWEVSVLKRVELYEDEIEDSTSLKTITKPQAKISNHSEIGIARRYKEQGVDEILHLKILQVLNEKGFLPKKADRSSANTLVLATGDARGGQFNKDGFPGAVREALKRGWNVELWSFTSGLSRAWKETAKREKWYEMGKFTIWAMDDFAEQLVEVNQEEYL